MQDMIHLKWTFPLPYLLQVSSLRSLNAEDKRQVTSSICTARQPVPAGKAMTDVAKSCEQYKFCFLLGGKAYLKALSPPHRLKVIQDMKTPGHLCVHIFSTNNQENKKHKAKN